MAEEMEVGCALPIGGPVREDVEESKGTAQQTPQKEVRSMIQVGKKVPDFVAPGYQQS